MLLSFDPSLLFCWLVGFFFNSSHVLDSIMGLEFIFFVSYKQEIDKCMTRNQLLAECALCKS